MNITPTSLAAFDSVEINERQRDVMDTVRLLYAAGLFPSDQDIANHLGWTINRVTPRRGELAAQGLIQPAGKRTGPTGRKVTVWMPVPQQLSLLMGISP